MGTHTIILLWGQWTSYRPYGRSPKAFRALHPLSGTMHRKTECSVAIKFVALVLTEPNNRRHVWDRTRRWRMRRSASPAELRRPRGRPYAPPYGPPYGDMGSAGAHKPILHTAALLLGRRRRGRFPQAKRIVVAVRHTILDNQRDQQQNQSASSPIFSII
jgi:hypothetical protein